MQTEDPCLEVHGTMHMCAWPSPHTSGWLSGPSNVSSLIVELRHDRVLMPSLELTAWKEGCGRSGCQKGSRRGSLGLSKLATHRAKTRFAGVSGFALSKGDI